MIDVSFMLDVLVQFNTGFYRRGNLVNSRKEIVINYIETWFLIDVLASLPYNYIITIPTAE